jgi:hypothetical protein
MRAFAPLLLVLTAALGSVSAQDAAPKPKSYSPEEMLSIIVKVSHLVPHGKTMAKSKFFAATGLTQERLGETTRNQFSKTKVHEAHRLSSAFEIQWLYDVTPEEVKDPQIYMIRVIHVPTGKVIAHSWKDAPALPVTPRREPGPLPSATVTYLGKRLVKRSEVKDKELGTNLTWVIKRDGETVLQRSAAKEMEYELYMRNPGTYTVHLAMYVERAYRQISNTVEFTLPE